MRNQWITLSFIAVMLCAAACKSKTEGHEFLKSLPPEKLAQPEPAPPSSEPAVPAFKTTYFNSAASALEEIVKRTDPMVIGFGEFHQLHGTSDTLSALERFRTQLLPALAPETSDLVVETWVPKGCGKTEKKVIKEVEEVSERPKETENETVKLIQEAESLGVQPHILDVKCEEYEALFDENGEMDFLKMLELVGSLLGNRGEQVLEYRKTKPVEGRKRVVLYGGAIHNDLYFEPEWETTTFGPRLQKRVEKRYVAVDVYVPEFINNNDILKEERWFPTYQQRVSDEQVMLIELAGDSFIIVFKKGVKNPSG